MTCVDEFQVLAPPYLASGLSKPSRLPPFLLMCALPLPHALGLDPHTFVDGELVLVEYWLVRVGVGAPCLGGGFPSLSSSLSQVLCFRHGWIIRYCALPAWCGVRVLGFLSLYKQRLLQLYSDGTFVLELLYKNCIKLCLHFINKIFDFGGPSLFACGECSMVEVILFLNPLLFFT